MEVTYTLDPGPVEHFGPLAITGLERLDPGYVEGRIRWQRGAVYDEAKVEEARRALIASGSFSTVRITPLADPDNPGDVRMTVDVTERLHRSIGVGLAYNTSQGVGAHFLGKPQPVRQRRKFTALRRGRPANRRVPGEFPPSRFFGH